MARAPDEMMRRAAELSPGAGDMAERIRAFDWSRTPLGPLESWPLSLKTAVRIMLSSRYPMFVWWGPELTNLYNDAYIPVLGARHPDALGRSAPRIWSEIWDVVGPQAETVLREQRGTWNESVLLLMERYGTTEETYFTFSYSPAPDDEGGVAGVFCACTEDTRRILGERRLRTLRGIGEKALTDPESAEQACRSAIPALVENPHDVPFALLYLLDRDGRRARLCGAASVDAGSSAAPELVVLGEEGDVWDFAAVVAGSEAKVVDDLAKFGRLPAGPWHDDAVRQAIVLPLARSGVQEIPAGFLVAGISPRLVFDEEYRSFLDLVAGQVATAVANARAYEEEKARAEALAELDRAKTAFFSNVSHEFRTPLTLMLGPLEELLEQSERPFAPGDRERLEVAHRSSLRLLKLVNTMLDFSRIEAGRIRASYEPVDLSASTAELASVFRAAIERAGLRFTVDCPPLPEPVWVDRDMWEKIVLNLVSNAFKYTLEGEIDVRLEGEGGEARLTVRDTGVGISQDEIPRIFERFHRIANSRGRTHEGTGIGLALVQELVRLHGGEVRAESDGVDRGSRFVVSVPLGNAHLDPKRIRTAPEVASTRTGPRPFEVEASRWLPEPEVEPVSSSGIEPDGEPRPRVLLAEDNADMRGYVARLLGERFEVEAVADGAAALRAVRERPPDLVLSDVMMPRIDGFELLKHLRGDPATSAIPVILVSARAGEESRVEGMEAGADDYVTKPFTARELVSRVDAHVRMARIRRESEVAARESLEALRDADRMKDEFLATLSHELRTPLTSILGWAQLLRSGRATEREFETGLEAIMQSAKVQSQLIEDVLDISRVTTGKMRLDRRPADLRKVIEAAVATVRPAAEGKRIDLRAELDAHLGRVSIDPDRIQQVVWNLLSNAVKFTHPGGRVEVRGMATADGVTIEVRDTGRGIPAAFLPHIFERFRQWDSSSRRAQTGLGLGLALARELTELHGGEIRVQSEEGKGSCFTVHLPIAGQKARIEEASRDTGARPRAVPGMRILLIDDDESARSMFRTVLVKEGAEVAGAASVDEALRILDEFDPDLAITDIAMPNRDGYDFLRELRARPNRAMLPVMALTAQGSQKRESPSPEFAAYLSKPVDLRDLLDAIGRLAVRGEGKFFPRR